MELVLALLSDTFSSVMHPSVKHWRLKTSTSFLGSTNDEPDYLQIL